jgi:hypothetical protein
MPKRTDIQSILIIGLMVLGGCSKSFPLEKDCEKRVSNSMSKLPVKLENVHSKLLFDFSAADATKAAAILQDGYAGSGRPSVQICTGECSNQSINPSAKTPVVSPDKKEIFVQGASGPTTTVITQACALESKGVWLKAVTYSPFIPADAENNKIAQ